MAQATGPRENAFGNPADDFALSLPN